MHIAALDPESVDKLLEQPLVTDGKQTIAEVIENANKTFKEHIFIAQFRRMELGK